MVWHNPSPNSADYDTELQVCGTFPWAQDLSDHAEAAQCRPDAKPAGRFHHTIY